MGDEQDPILELDFRDYGGKFSFRSLEEIEAWLNRE